MKIAPVTFPVAPKPKNGILKPDLPKRFPKRSPARSYSRYSPVMHLLGAKCQRKEHTGGGEPASGFAFQGHVLLHLAYNHCTTAAPRPRGRPGPPNFSRGPAATHPAARWGMPGDTWGFSSRSFGRGAAQPGGGGENTGRHQNEEDAVPVPSPPESPGASDTASQGRPTDAPARRRGARRPSRPRPAPAGPVSSPPAGRAGGARACPTALFLIRAELASGPPRPLDPRAPGAAGLTFPARPGPAQPADSSEPHPPRRVSGSSATRGACRSAPRACAPPRRGPLAATAFRRPSLPQPLLRVRTAGTQAPGRRAGRGSGGSVASQAGWVASSAELSTHSC